MIVERGVNEHADRVADALDAGRQIDTVEAVALAQEIVRLTKALRYLAGAADDPLPATLREAADFAGAVIANLR